MSRIELQKFMELRETARGKLGESSSRKASSTDKASSSWQSLLESKRQEMGVSSTPAAPAKASATPVRTSAADLSGSLEDKVEELRDRKSQGLSVRELGNFIDVRA